MKECDMQLTAECSVCHKRFNARGTVTGGIVLVQHDPRSKPCYGNMLPPINTKLVDPYWREKEKHG